MGILLKPKYTMQCKCSAEHETSSCASLTNPKLELQEMAKKQKEVVEETQDMDEALDLLTPGSVWIRPGKDRPAIVLTVANSHLDDDRQEKYPVTITYLDYQDQVCAVTAQAFVNGREFDHVHPAIESLMMRVLLSPDEDEDVEDQEEEEEESEDKEVEDLADSEDLTIQSSIEAEFTATGEGKFAISSDELEECLLQFEQEPDLEDQLLRSTLVFSLTSHDHVNTETLGEVFSNPDASYESFTIQGIQVAWTTFLGVYPLVEADGEISAKLIFTSPLEYTQEVEDVIPSGDVVTTGTEVTTPSVTKLN